MPNRCNRGFLLQILSLMCLVCRMLAGKPASILQTGHISNKICNKKPLLHLVGISFPQINGVARSKSHQICKCVNFPLRQPSTYIRLKSIILLVMTRNFSIFKFQIRFRVLFSLTLKSLWGVKFQIPPKAERFLNLCNS